jgi:methyl-accepting chemotaxis protein
MKQRGLSISVKITLSISLLIVCVTGVETWLSVRQIRESSEKEIRQLQTTMESNLRQSLKNYVEMAAKTIRHFYETSQDVEALKASKLEEIKPVVDAKVAEVEAWLQAHPEAEEAQRLKALKTMVKTARFGEKGGNYLFVNDLDNVCVVHAFPIEGKDFSGVQDEEGVYFVREMTELARGPGQGMVAYQWPPEKGADPELKITYVKRIPGTDWYVGAGDHVENMEQALRREAMAQVDTLSLDRQEYYFYITDLQGEMLMHPNPKLIGVNLIKKGVNFMRRMVDTAKEGGGFVKYEWPLDKPRPKLAYVIGFKPWDMMVGMAVYTDFIQNRVAERRTQAEAAVADQMQSALLIGLTFIALAVAVVLLVVRVFLHQPLGRILDFAGRVSEGDLDAKPRGRFTAEMARLKDAIAAMVDRLTEKIEEADEKSREATAKSREAEQALEETRQARREAEQAQRRGVLEAAGRIEEVVAEVEKTSKNLLERINDSENACGQQKDKTTETATAMEEMNATVLEVAKNASDAANNAESARQQAQSGEAVVSDTIEAIKQARSQVADLKDIMASLGDQAQDIGRVMNVITDIADQTNLLALNAAIEAARAGEAGRGFAVVADEVRKLAEKTMDATKEVGEAISRIQDETQRSVQATDAAVDSVSSGADMAEKSGQTLKDIVQLVDGATDQVRNIATAAEEQSAASEQINTATSDIHQIAETTADSMSASAAAVKDLDRLASSLSQIVEEMKK